MADEGPWPISDDLVQLHNAAWTYAVNIQAGSAAKQEKTAEGPLAHSALASLHRTAIVLHCSVRSLCEAGWTQVTPILIRTLLDVIVNVYAIAIKQEDSEYMAFKFLCSDFVKLVQDTDTAEEVRKHDQEQLDRMRRVLKGADVKRVDDFIANFKPVPYWFRPEFSSPGTIFREKIPRLFDMYRQFSGSTHASLIGSLLFSDTPDAPSINPAQNPIRTASAIVSSSRLLIDISWGRAEFDGFADTEEYKFLVKTLVLPLREKVEAKVSTGTSTPQPTS